MRQSRTHSGSRRNWDEEKLRTMNPELGRGEGSAGVKMYEGKDRTARHDWERQRHTTVQFGELKIRNLTLWMNFRLL